MKVPPAPHRIFFVSCFVVTYFSKHNKAFFDAVLNGISFRFFIGEPLQGFRDGVDSLSRFAHYKTILAMGDGVTERAR